MSENNKKSRVYTTNKRRNVPDTAPTHGANSTTQATLEQPDIALTADSRKASLPNSKPVSVKQEQRVTNIDQYMQRLAQNSKKNTT